MTADERPEAERLVAVVLAGGRARRLDGADKAALRLRGATYLEHVLAALAPAEAVAVVGDPRPTTRPVLWTREEPAYGGPVAGALAGLRALAAAGGWTPGAAGAPGQVAVVAVDMPLLGPATLDRLRAALPGRDASQLLDPDGRGQLALVLDGVRLARAAHEVGDGHAMSWRAFLAGWRVAGVASRGEEHRDVDTPEEMTRLT